jgi:hypothetical protein
MSGRLRIQREPVTSSQILKALADRAKELSLSLLVAEASDPGLQLESSSRVAGRVSGDLQPRRFVADCLELEDALVRVAAAPTPIRS